MSRMSTRPLSRTIVFHTTNFLLHDRHRSHENLGFTQFSGNRLFPIGKIYDSYTRELCREGSHPSILTMRALWHPDEYTMAFRL